MQTLSSTDLAIAVAIRADTLRVVEREGRFGSFVAVEDDFGIIEVANDATEANARIAAIRGRIQ